MSTIPAVPAGEDFTEVLEKGASLPGTKANGFDEDESGKLE